MSTKSTIIKLLGKTPKFFFSEKSKLANKRTLEASEENIISDDALVSEQLNNLFQNEETK